MRSLVLAALLLACFPFLALRAQAPAPATPPAPAGAAAAPVEAPGTGKKKLIAITRDLEPYSFEQDGRRKGYAWELWNEVSRELGYEYEVKVTDSAKNMVKALQEGQADVAIGALSINAERESVIDFSQPFYESGLQIVVVAGASSFNDMMWSTLGTILNLQFVGALALLIFAMLLISHLVWMFEHKVNEAMWPANYLEGMWESFWWTISTLLVGGADNKGPIGVGGRIVAIAWMLLSIVLLSLLTASFTTTLTLNSLKGEISGPGDLPGKRVATIAGSSSETYLKKGERNITVEPYKTVAECLAALKKGTVKAVVFDSPILKYEVAKAHDTSLTIVGNLFERNNYGFGLQQDSKERENINRVLLKLTESGFTDELQKKWFGEDK
ncbi:MAG: transporter substrate-binding domain-containing protein [Candidatus Methylacidiphilales bacterium]|nr:transporter substrate-binding domain-containing protein [Candidatus Methylacidiphilales bacterium]